MQVSQLSLPNLLSQHLDQPFWSVVQLHFVYGRKGENMVEREGDASFVGGGEGRMKGGVCESVQW